AAVRPFSGGSAAGHASPARSPHASGAGLPLPLLGGCHESGAGGGAPQPGPPGAGAGPPQPGAGAGGAAGDVGIDQRPVSSSAMWDGVGGQRSSPFSGRDGAGGQWSSPFACGAGSGGQRDRKSTRL